MKLIRLVALTAAISSILGGCASSLQLSENAISIRANMATKQANAHIASWSVPTANRGGLCIIGLPYGLTKLDYSMRPKTVGAAIKFAAHYAYVADAAVEGNVSQGTGRLVTKHQAVRTESVVDLRSLDEIRVLKSVAFTLKLCRGFKPGYLVVMKPKESLPSKAELMFNAVNQENLDQVLAVLTYFSPQARLVSGAGM